MEYPKLRQINAFPTRVSGKEMICLQDPFKYIDKVLFVPEPAFFIITLFDGRHSLHDIQAEYMRRYGELLYTEHIERMIRELDAVFFLDNENFKNFKRGLEEEFRKTKVREGHNGGLAYNQNPEKLQGEIEGYLNSSKDFPDTEFSKKENIKGIMAPHIDFKRGGLCYGAVYREIRNLDAKLILIFGTAHLPTKNLFTLTRKPFKTSLGIMETDTDFIDELEENYSRNLYEDELVHKTEHSIEFQVVFLKHLFNQDKDVKIVPILCGSFFRDGLRDGNPLSLPELSDFILTFKKTLSKRREKILMIAAADLAHIGPQFGDSEPVNPLILQELEREDLRMLSLLEEMKLKEFSKDIHRDNDRRHICGYACTYTMLSVMEAKEGRLIKYEQTTDPHTRSTVSFAGMIFY